MKKALFVIVSVLCVSVYARIGESEDQCLSRYGQESANNGGSKGNRSVAYLNDSFSVSCEFYQNKCFRVTFTVKNKDAEFSKDVIDKLLSANSGQSSWKEVDPGKKWFREDGKVSAEIKGKSLFIVDIKTEENKANAADQKKKGAINKF